MMLIFRGATSESVASFSLQSMDHDFYSDLLNSPNVSLVETKPTNQP